jgi:hypothetical protein
MNLEWCQYFEIIIQTHVIWVYAHNYKRAIYHSNIGARFGGGGDQISLVYLKLSIGRLQIVLRLLEHLYSTRVSMLPIEPCHPRRPCGNSRMSMPLVYQILE